MSMDKKLTSAVYAAVEKAYDHRCDIEDAADEILEIIKADRQRRGEPVDKGPWKAGVNRSDKRTFIESDDFTHDVRLYVDGDFADQDEKLAYALGIADQLNAAPQPAEPVKSHLKVSYDNKVDCLYVVCDSNEPADAEEDDKGILYRRAISDGRLVGITIMNFMGPHAESRYGKGTP